MSARARTTRSVLLSLALFGLACTDAPTGTRESGEETFIVSVVGVAAGDAGIVLRLSGAAESVEPARHSLDLAWSTDAGGGTTVALVGALPEASDLLVVRRRVASEPLSAEVMQVAGEDGELLEVTRARVETRRLEQ